MKTQRSRTLTLLLGAAVIALAFRIDFLIQCASYLISLFKPIAAAFLVAITVDAPVSFVERRLCVVKGRFRRGVSVMITLLLLAGLVLLVLWRVVPLLASALAQLFERLPQYAQAVGDSAFLDFLGLNMNISGIFSALDVREISTLAAPLLRSIGSSASLVSEVFLSAALSVYILVDKHKLLSMVERSKKLLPDSWRVERIYSVLYQCAVTFKRFISGQMLEGIILGVLCLVGMSLIGLPYALLISTFIGFTAVIPVVGAYIGAIPSAFLLLLESPFQALLFLLFLIPLQQFEGSVIYPRVVGEAVGMSGFFVFAAIVLGSGIGGISGVLLAVPAMAVLHDLVSTALRKREAE